jgi:hypothetical protein
VVPDARDVRGTVHTTGRRPDAPPKSKPATPAAAGLAAGAVKRGLQPAYDAGRDAGKLYAAMHGGVTGLGTDEAAIHAVLRDKSTAEVSALRRAYADRYPGRSLDADLASELSGADLDRAKAAMAGRREQASAVGLQQALGGMRSDAAAVFRTLEGKSPDELRRVQQAFQKRTGTPLSQALEKELSSADAARARALLAADPHRATAVQLRQAMAGVGTDEVAIHDTLAAVDPARRAAVETAYRKEFGTSLREDLARELSGADLDLARAFLDNDTPAAAAARVRRAIAGFGTDDDAVVGAFAGTSPAERTQIEQIYRQRYGESLDVALRGDLSGRDLAEARSAARRGTLSDVERIERAMRGAGTDEGTLREVLKGKSTAEIAALDRQFRARNGGRSLEHTIGDETSGRDGFDLKLALRGEVDLSTTAGLQEAVRRARETRDFERAGAGNVLGRAFTAFGNSGDGLDDSTARLEQVLDRAQASGSPLTEEEAARVRTLLGYQHDDVAQYRAAKDTAADAAGTGAAVVAGVAATVVTGGAAAPLVLAAGAAAGASAKVVVGAAVRGELREDAVANDARAGAVDGLASAVTGLAARGIGSVVSRTMSTGESAAARLGLGRAPSATAAATTEAATTRGFVGTTIERTLTGAGRGGVSGTTAGATTAALDPNTYQGNLVGVVGTIAGQAIRGAQTGIVGALDPTAAVTGTAVSRLAPRIDQVTGAALSKVGVDVKTATEATGATGALRHATASFAAETPKKLIEGAAAASLGTLLTGDAEALLTATTDAVADRTTASAREAAVATTRRTVERLRR